MDANCYHLVGNRFLKIGVARKDLRVTRHLDKQEHQRSEQDASNEAPARTASRNLQSRVDHVRRSNRLATLAAESEPTIKVDMPTPLPPTKSEVALWRAFLADEIEAILKLEED